MRVEERGYTPQELVKNYENFAESMESEFVKMMLTEMKKSSSLGREKSQEENFYDDLMTNEYAANSAKRENYGIKEMILKQIMPEQLKAYRQNQGQ